MKAYTFSLKVRTDYALASNPPFLLRTAQITWLGPPSGIFIDFDEVHSLQGIHTFQLQGFGDWVGKIRIQWSLQGVGGTRKKAATNMDKELAYINGDSNAKFIVDKG